MCKYKVGRTLYDINHGSGAKFDSGKKAIEHAKTHELKVYKLDDKTKDWNLWWKQVK